MRFSVFPCSINWNNSWFHSRKNQGILCFCERLIGPRDGRGFARTIKPMDSSSDAADPAVSPTARKTRYDASLCLLTRRVSQMLQDSCSKVVDLNAIARALNVPKRRLYDVTNVLEGISLTRKTSKNHIEWLGSKCGALSQEMNSLVQEERKLDELIKSCTWQVNQMCQSGYNQRFAYLTYEDVQRIPKLKEQTVIVIKAPLGTKLEVPHPEESLQVHLSSTKGPIEAFLCADDPVPYDATHTRVSNGTLTHERSPGPNGPSQRSSSAASTPVPPVSAVRQRPTDEQQSFVSIAPPLKVCLEPQLLTEAEAEGITDCFPSAQPKQTPMDASV